MAEDLWKIRERKQMSVAQLALHSGLRQDLIDEYEEGRPLTSTHRAKLAKVLYVAEDDIKRQSAPRPKREKPAPPPEQPRPEAPPKEQTPKPALEPKSEPAVRQGQIDYLKGLGQHLGILPQQMEDEIGKPLSALTAPEATHWIRTFQARVPPNLTASYRAKPPDYRSKRAHLPEAELTLLFGRALGQSPQYWLNLQTAYDLKKTEVAISKQLRTITKVAPV